MAKQHLAYNLCQSAHLGALENDRTIRQYKRNIKIFGRWAREQGLREVSEVTTEIVQRYEEELERYGLSASTIHSRLAPVCRAMDISMADVVKPKRSARTLTRSRGDEDVNRQGKRELENPKYERLVEFQRAVGIRRRELSRLTGDCLVHDESGYLCVHVKRGKGGKEQLQRIAKKDIELVKSYFKGLEPDEKLFCEDEMKNHIDLHGIRASHAREREQFYEEKLKTPEARKRMREELMARWEHFHSPDNLQGGKEAYDRMREAFKAEIEKDTPYKLRGENKARAEALGRPTEYDRLALMAVSVFHLSHWRLSVTAVNYLV
jgi:hypothetical protein